MLALIDCYCAGIQLSVLGVPTEGSFFIIGCFAGVPGGNNVVILFEGDGLVGDSTIEPSPGTFATTRNFNSIDTSNSGVYTCTLLVNDVVIDTIMFGIDVTSKQKHATTIVIYVHSACYYYSWLSIHHI